MDLNKITETIIGCAYKVSNNLGIGFLEKVYENALVIELTEAGLKAEPQKPISVFYKGIIVGNYAADILVEESVIVELKVAKIIEDSHEAQLLNYLRATNLQVGLLINFGTPKLGIKRKRI
jgi:GxxExxY protein